MDEESHEVTLRLLRETRAEMVARFDGIDHRLHWIEQRLGPAREGEGGSDDPTPSLRRNLDD